MRVFKAEEMCTVKDAPVGLFLLERSGEIICISEYETNGRRDCTIVSSGEHYCGEGDAALGYPLVIQ